MQDFATEENEVSIASLLDRLNDLPRRNVKPQDTTSTGSPSGQDRKSEDADDVLSWWQSAKTASSKNTRNFSQGRQTTEGVVRDICCLEVIPDFSLLPMTPWDQVFCGSFTPRSVDVKEQRGKRSTQPPKRWMAAQKLSLMDAFTQTPPRTVKTMHDYRQKPRAEKSGAKTSFHNNLSIASSSSSKDLTLLQTLPADHNMVLDELILSLNETLNLLVSLHLDMPTGPTKSDDTPPLFDLVDRLAALEKSHGALLASVFKPFLSLHRFLNAEEDLLKQQNYIIGAIKTLVRLPDGVHTSGVGRLAFP